MERCSRIETYSYKHVTSNYEPVLYSQVLDEGRLVEFDEPYLLLRNKDSLFSKMVEHTSKHLATNLYEDARQAYFSRHELSEDSDLDLLPPYSPSPLPSERPNDDDWETPLPRISRGSSEEKERLLYVTTV